MEYRNIVIANQAINMSEIRSKKRGTTKEYATVDEKIKAFRMLYPDGGINTKIISISNGVCVAHAEITDNTGRVLGAATASKTQTKENSDSFIEACETAAVGRALRFCGIGLDNMQTLSKEESEYEDIRVKEKVMAYFFRHNFNEEKLSKVCDRYKIEFIGELTGEMCRHYIMALEKQGGNINE